MIEDGAKTGSTASLEYFEQQVNKASYAVVKSQMLALERHGGSSSEQLALIRTNYVCDIQSFFKIARLHVFRSYLSTHI